jgi:HK97 family phage portal protein
VSLLAGLREKRATGDELSAAAYRLRSGKGLGGSYVTLAEAQRVSTVYACARLHADTISTLPVDTFRRRAGVKTEIDPPGWVKRPNPDQRWTEWLDAVVMSCMYHGEAFGLITPGPDMFPQSITLLDPKCMVALPNGDWQHEQQVLPRELVWQVKTVQSTDVRHGMSPITLARVSIGVALAGREYVRQFFDDGGHPSLEIISDLPDLTSTQADEIKAGAVAVMTGNREPWVHGSGLTTKTWQLSPADADFLNVMGATDLDVCRFMGLRQPELIGVPVQGGSSITYANTEQRGTSFQQFTIGPFIRRLEEALSDNQLSPAGQFIKLNPALFLRGDQATQAKIEDMRLRNGSASPDEVRANHDEAPIPDGLGNRYLWPPYSVKEESTDPSQPADTVPANEVTPNAVV